MHPGARHQRALAVVTDQVGEQAKGTLEAGSENSIDLTERKNECGVDQVLAGRSNMKGRRKFRAEIGTKLPDVLRDGMPVRKRRI